MSPEKNSTFALWIYTALFHALVGILFLLVGNTDFSFTHITRAAQSLADQVNTSDGASIESVQNVKIPPLPSTLTMLFYLGLLHFIITLFIVLIVLVGNLFKPKILGAMKFLGIIQSLACIGTTVAVETVLGSFHEAKEFAYEVRMGSTKVAPEGFASVEHLTIVDNAGLIIMASALTIAIISGVAFVSALSPKEPLPKVYLTFPISILTATVAGNLIFSTSSLHVIILGSVWAVSSVLIDFVGGLAKYIGKTVSKILTGLLFFILFLFAGGITFLFFMWLTFGKKYDTYTPEEIDSLTSIQKSIYKYYYLLGENGSYLVSALLQASCVSILSLCAGSFTIYEALNDKKKSEEETSGQP